MTESSPNWGGQELRLVREAQWLIQRGYRVYVACPPGGELARRLPKYGIPFFEIDFRITDASDLLRIARLCRADIIHTRGSRDTTCALWARAHGFCVIRSRHMTVPEKPSLAQRWLYRHGSERLVAASESIRRGLVAQMSVPAETIDVVGEGADLEEYHPDVDGAEVRREWGISPSQPLFGVIGMLRGEKGQRRFVNAAMELLRIVPRARFVIVGDGNTPYAEKLRAKVHRLFPGPNGSLFLAGYREDVPQVTAALDVLVVPSIQEAQTMVIPQAFAMAKPVIATRVGGIPEIVRDGETGVLVEPNDDLQLATAMLSLLENPTRARRLGATAHAYARQSLSFDTKMRALIASYRAALDQHAEITPSPAVA